MIKHITIFILTFTLFSQAFSQNCGSVTNLSASNITKNSALLTWDDVPGASYYIFKGGIAGSIRTVTLYFNKNEFQIPTYLRSCTSYKYTISAVCSGSVGPESSAYIFQTAGCTSCSAPTQLSASVRDPKTVTLSWNSVPGADSYILEGAIANTSGTPFWISFPITDTILVITKLTANTNYVWRVSSVCNGTISSPSTLSYFSTPNGRIGTEKMSNLTSNNGLVEISVYPNPASDYLNISLPIAENQSTDLNIFSMDGKSIFQKSITSNNNHQIDISDLSSGTYQIVISNGSNILHKRLVIAN